MPVALRGLFGQKGLSHSSRIIRRPITTPAAQDEGGQRPLMPDRTQLRSKAQHKGNDTGGSVSEERSTSRIWGARHLARIQSSCPNCWMLKRSNRGAGYPMCCGLRAGCSQKEKLFFLGSTRTAKGGLGASCLRTGWLRPIGKFFLTPEGVSVAQVFAVSLCKLITSCHCQKFTNARRGTLWRALGPPTVFPRYSEPIGGRRHVHYSRFVRYRE
jgi:hypothetical protein